MLLIDHGDPPSLALLAIQSDAARVIVWHPRWGSAAMRESNAARHAQLFGAELLMHDLPNLAIGPESRPALAATRVLTEAAFAARALGCARVLDPTQVGPDHTAVGEALNRAMAVTRLLEYTGAERSLVIDLPLVDLTDAELIELADDAGAPLDQCWPCANSSDQPCASCPECERWQRAFEELGVPWPWKAALAVG